MAGLSGCVAIVATIFDPLIADEFEVSRRHDISTTNDTAIIAGFKKGVMERTTCNIIQPAATMELIVDAGKTSLVVGCVYDNLMTSMGRYKFAGVEFDAEAGHTYEISRAMYGIKLIDVSDSNRLVIRRPLMFSETYAAESSSKAVVISGSGSDTIRCNFLRTAGPLKGDQRADIYRRVGAPVPSFYENEYFNVLLTPGQVTVTARCINFEMPFFSGRKTRVKQAYTADISFVAKPGHLYEIEINIKRPECAQVTDVSRDELAITCEPATQIDELVGLTTIELSDL